MTGAPWWAVSTVTGFFTLAGVLLAQINAIVMDRARLHRDDARRWHDDRRAAYVRYLSATDAAVRCILAETITDRNSAKEEQKEVVAELMSALSDARTEIQLVCSVDLYNIARELLVEVEVLASVAQDERSERDQAQQRVADLRRAFLTVARTELGVGV
ncbi:hypothetical protein [Micromonospora sp. NPDC048843]|uniref:hypothetical protein n=1 Tax=Micromonospora sp. NPDC048843 TaxID=3155389 RepID=UPI0033E4C23F